MTLTERKLNEPRQTASVSSIADQARQALVCIAESDLPVLLVGERGVGKRTTALEIHTQSRRSRQPFREFLCSELDAEIIQSISELDGTAYMTEVGELNPALQDTLIEVYFSSAAEVHNCRLLFSSSRELLEAVRTLHMREEFYYLISAITLRLSPLRMRKREILKIADTLLAHYSRQFDRPKPCLSQEAINFLMDHSWPDNLPELETAIKTFVAIGDQSIALAALRSASPAPRSDGRRKSLSLKEATRRACLEVEHQMISQVLEYHAGNRKRAAHELGISYKTLLYKVKQVGLVDVLSSSRIGAAV
jgi:DNA-binding NtrC family response regulator